MFAGYDSVPSPDPRWPVRATGLARTGTPRTRLRLEMPIHDRAFRAGTMLAEDGRRHRPHGHRGLAPDQAAVLNLQGLAGNAAVSHAIESSRSGNVVTSVNRIELRRDAMSPQKGVEDIRKQTANKLTLALTQRGLEDTPPMFKAEKPQKGDKGW